MRNDPSNPHLPADDFAETKVNEDNLKKAIFSVYEQIKMGNVHEASNYLSLIKATFEAELTPKILDKLNEAITLLEDNFIIAAENKLKEILDSLPD